MLRKLRSDKGFLEFFRSFKLPAVIIPLCLGVVLIFISGTWGGGESVKEEEDPLVELCSSVGGVGRCYAQASFDTEGEVVAVAVVCEGADNTEVRAELYRLISSFYGIGYNRISVLKISE